VAFDAFTNLQAAFAHLGEMKIKKASVAGYVCRKLAKHLILGNES